VCGAAILPGFVLHLFSRHGVCKYSYYSGVHIRPCGRRPRVARAGAFTFTFADLKAYFCSFEFALVGEMTKKIRTVFWNWGSGSAGRNCRRLSKKPGRARTSERRGRGHRSATRRARACTSASVLVLVVLALSCVIGGVQAAFTPVDSAALKAAVGTCTRTYSNGAYVYSCTGGCLGETTDGSCPTFAASNDATGNPYGVVGDWDVSAVTTMEKSKCTRSPPLCGHGAFCCCVLLNVKKVSSDHNSHTIFLVVCLWNGNYFNNKRFQTLYLQQCSTRHPLMETSPTGIRVASWTCLTVRASLFTLLFLQYFSQFQMISNLIFIC
jgi:hypothetical protein